MTLKVLSVTGNAVECEGKKRVSYPANVPKPSPGDTIEAFDHRGTLRPTDEQLKGKPAKK